jgi:MFS family permease
MQHTEQHHAPLFKEWLPNWVIIAALILCIVPSVLLLGLYNSNVAFAAGFLDVEAEDMQFLFMITYGTLAASMLIESRFFRYFPPRNYILLFISGNIVVLFISSLVHQYYLLIFLRFLQGILMIVGPSAFLQLLFSRIRSRSAKLIGYSVYFGSLLMSGTFTLHIVTWALDRYGWQEMVYANISIYVFILLIVLIIFNPHRHLPHYPLYQIDFSSFFFLLVILMSGSYVLVYGRKMYWFESRAICGSLVAFLFTSGIFIFRQLHRRRPLYRFEVFKFREVRLGLLLLVALYIFRAALNSVYAAMAGIWQWEFRYIVRIQYINVAGIAVSVIISSYLLSRSFPFKYLFAIGFFVLGLQFLWFTFLFYPDTTIPSLAIPLFLQGFGTGWLFTPLILFIVSAVPPELAPIASATALAVRFWATGIGFAIMQNAQYILQRKHYIWLQQFISDNYTLAQERLEAGTQAFLAKGFPPIEAQHLALKKISAGIDSQSFLLGNMEIYTVLAIGSFLLVVVILINTHLSEVAINIRDKVFGIW